MVIAGSALTPDEQDSLAANCPVCWAYPSDPCKVLHADHSLGRMRRPHRKRVQRAGRRGILGGIGRVLLQQEAYRSKTRGLVT